MTPNDIRSQRFSTRLLHGLSPKEVKAFIEDVAEAFGALQKTNASLAAWLKAVEGGADRSRLAPEPPQTHPPEISWMTPDDIRSQRFSTRFLYGLSPEEVGAFIEDVAVAFGALQNTNAFLAARLKAVEGADWSRLAPEPPQPHSPVDQALRDAESQAESVIRAAREKEAAALGRVELLRTTAIQEVEALLHDARKRAQALIDEATERQAAALADAEASKSRLQLEAERYIAEATERAASLTTEAREEELAIRKEIDRLTQHHIQLLDDMRATLNTFHEWLATVDPRGRAQDRQYAFEMWDTSSNGFASSDELKAG
jgi:DivIVA domain-containing protein